MPIWIQAGLWGLAAGGALVVGALVAWLIEVPQRIVASVMAFGAGVLISALAFDLVDEAETKGGLTATVLGFLVGAVAYLLANLVLAKRGARHRKRSGEQQPSEEEQSGSGSAIAIGALLDGIPESVVLGLSLLGGNVRAVNENARRIGGPRRAQRAPPVRASSPTEGARPAGKRRSLQESGVRCSSLSGRRWRSSGWSWRSSRTLSRRRKGRVRYWDRVLGSGRGCLLGCRTEWTDAQAQDRAACRAPVGRAGARRQSACLRWLGHVDGPEVHRLGHG